MALFNYDPMDLTQPAFRLARLLRGSGVEIYCEIFQAFLDQPESIIPYEALSYTWGSTELTDSIKIDGSQLAVTQNLYLALQYLRHVDEDRILWIDGLCIDQRNDKEKGHQVQQMSNIYRRAERVIIWLGPATYDTNVVMDSMNRLEKESIHYPRNSLRSSDQAWRDIWSDIQPDLRNVHSNLAAHQRSGLESLLERPWFSRVWILQEVANARAGVVVCGTKSVSVGIFALVPSLIGITPEVHCQSVLDIMSGRSREQSWWSQSRDLRTLLLKFGRSCASDPRDNVYALLGLSSDTCDSDLLQADYSRPVRDVICDVVSFLYRLPDLCDTDFLSDWIMPQFLASISLLGNVALDWAEQKQDASIIKLLLESDNIDLNSKDKDGATPLLKAVQSNNGAMVKLFLARNDIDVNSKDNNSVTPLLRAVLSNNEAMVKLFLARNAIDVNSKDNNSVTPLLRAVLSNNEAMVKLFLARNAIDVNSKDKNSVTPLLRAVLSNNEAMVKLFLARNDIDVNSKDENSVTPLLRAVQGNNEAIVNLFPAHYDIDVKLKDKNSVTLLRTPQSINRAIVGLFLARDDIDVNSKDNKGQTPLLTAVNHRNVSSVELLLRRKDIDVNSESYDGTTPLLRAVENWDMQIIKLLLRRKDIVLDLEGTKGEELRQIRRKELSRCIAM